MVTTPDVKNVRSLIKFFQENEFMTNSEMAQLVNISSRTIRYWKKKCNIKDKMPHFFIIRKGPKKPYVQVLDQKVWDNHEWFNEQYIINDIGIRTLSKMINKDFHFIWNRLRRYNIKTKPRSSQNPCCTFEWCDEHYNIYGYSIRKCAKLAGIHPYTFVDWLIKFKIHIRDKYEAEAGERSPLYGTGKQEIA